MHSIQIAGSSLSRRPRGCRTWSNSRHALAAAALAACVWPGAAAAQVPLATPLASETGALRQFRFESQRLTDRSSIAVNVSNGNLVFQSDDLHIEGTTLDLAVSRFYNSSTTRATDLGRGWSLSTAEGVELERIDATTERFFGPSGYSVKFTNGALKGNGERDYTQPEGLDAALTKRADGTFKLKWLASEERYEFDAQRRFTEHVNERSGQRLTFTYDSQTGRLQRITDTQNRVVSFTYNAQGLISTMRDETGNRTFTYGYDASGRLTSYTNPLTTSGVPTTTTYGYNAQNQLQSITDPEGNITWIRYVTGTDKVTSITRDANSDGSGGFTTSFAYDSGYAQCDPGQTSTEVNGPRADVADLTRYCISDSGKVRKVYDARGNKQDISYTSAGNVNTYAPASGASYVSEYDASNRLNKFKVPGGTVWSIDYNDGNSSFRPNKVTDPQGNALTYSYTPLGNLARICDATPCNPGGASTLVELDWNEAPPDPDLKGTLNWSKDPRGKKTSYEYDGEGNLIKVIYPKSGSGATLIGDTVYGYDTLSRLNTTTTPRPGSTSSGDTVLRTASYDELDRATEIKYPTLPSCPPGQEGCDSVRYSYDGNGNLAERVDGRKNEGRDDQKDTYAYDDRNLLDLATLRAGRSVDYAYDAAGNLSSIEYKSGNQSLGVTSYTYNAVNVVERITQPAGGQFNYTYNNDNQVETLTYPVSTGLTETRSYTKHRLTRIQVVKAGQSVSDLKYRWDLDRGGTQDTDMTALRTQLEDAVQGITTNYTYNDSLNRLTKAAETGGPSPRTYIYAYDRAGNLTTETVNGSPSSFSYNDVNQLTSGAGKTYSYDLAGNLRQVSPGPAFSYDQRARTMSITPQAQGAIPFDYADIDQTERLQTGGLQFTDTVLGLGLQAPDSAEPTTFLRNPDTGEALGMQTPQGSFYYLRDSLGTVSALADSAGAVASSYRYEPYGEAVGSPSGPVNPIRFQNQYLDSETGLYKMGMRYYDPAAFRWTQRDPLNAFQDPRQGNRYAFVGDDPVNGIDPRGAIGCWDPLDIGICEAFDDAVSAIAEEAGQFGVGCVPAGATTYAYTGGPIPVPFPPYVIGKAAIAGIGCVEGGLISANALP